MVRIKKLGLAGLLLMALVSACAPETNANLETIATPQAQVEQQPAAAMAAPTIPTHCQYGTCIRDTIVAKSETNLLVFFDLTDQNGEVILGEEKFIMGNLLVAGYLLSENSGEEIVFQAQLSNQDYYCYSGEDLPWNTGKPTATCGFSAPIVELKIVPEIGDRVRIELPAFNSFSQEVVVQERVVLE